MTDLATIEAARRDPVVFAEQLVGQPLWPHQREIVESTARYRCICAGRRSGKTRTFGVLALHTTFARPGSKVLIVSAGDRASKRMFADIASMAAQAPLLSGSVADETTSLLTLSNGSTIECVPASMAQVRSAEADLLIVDEAGFVPQSIWESAEPVVIARPGSRVLLCSTPWGGTEHFFRSLWRAGMASPSERVASWHWPSSISPLVDEELLEDIRQRSAPRYFKREYLAEWQDEAGAYFTESELEAAVSDDPMCDPAAAGAAAALGGVLGGVDWGGRHDAHALAVVSTAGRDDRQRLRFRVAWVEEHFSMPFDPWIDRLCELAGVFWFVALVSETNGVGQMPSQVLVKALQRQRLTGGDLVVWPTTTTARLKEETFGFVHLLLQQGRLVLPRHPELLKQLASLEYEQTESGMLKIAVPEARGHDDICMALMLAFTQATGDDLPSPPEPEEPDVFDEADLRQRLEIF